MAAPDSPSRSRDRPPSRPRLNRLFIDGQATLLTPEHQQTETDRDLHAKIGSTGKGIGAARADRIMRTATLWRDYSDQAHDTAKFLNDMIHGGSHIVIEGTQGYGLGLHAGHYPQCTSNNARAIDFLSAHGNKASTGSGSTQSPEPTRLEWQATAGR